MDAPPSSPRRCSVDSGAVARYGSSKASVKQIGEFDGVTSLFEDDGGYSSDLGLWLPRV